MTYGEQVQEALEELREQCGYSEERVQRVQAALAELREASGDSDETTVDMLIAYKNALEGAYATAAAKAMAWDAVDVILTRSARGEGHASAADVCQVGFEQQERLS